MEYILSFIAQAVIRCIELTGYAGIALLMGLESANIPIPSEIIMPFAGFLAYEGKLSLSWIVLWGAAGNLAGSLVSYAMGYYGGRPFLKKWGKFVFITAHDVERAEAWFTKYGSQVAFFSRLLPVARTFVSFPAGIAKTNIWKFSLYTFAGSLIWSFLLAYAGYQAGEHWDFLKGFFHKVDGFAIGIVGAGVAWWIWRRIKLAGSK
ncbi:MAG: DedA family protein [Candidatus Wildermuthbacteria bacterium]|nr:DedA family protein [Candidatus Wildermuthbacteria bacterium]